MRTKGLPAQTGSIIIEAMLAIVVLSIVVLAIVPMLSFINKRAVKSKYESQAGFLLQEAMEATYNIFISNWSAYPDGQYHIGKTSSNKWALIPQEETNLETRYTRSINIRRACRDVNGAIREDITTCNASETDTNTRLIDVTIAWVEDGKDRNLEANYTLTNF